jgi:hypothetical protein
MNDYKNLTDKELLDMIDSEDFPKIKEMQVLAKTDSEFADRLLDLKIKILSTIKDTQSIIDDLNKLLNSLPVNSPNRDKVIAKIEYYTEKFKNNG